MNENPIMILMYVGVAAYVLQMYIVDLKAARQGQPNRSALPGAVPCSALAIWISVVGALLILGAETGGEIALGIASEQSMMVWFFVFAALGAGVVEEIIFRGYLVVEDKGRSLLIASCVGFSLLFALLHPHLWSLDDGFALTLTPKGFFSSSILFVNSLWFYAARFGPWNPSRSIFPCMLAHAASNLGVFVVKLFQGYVSF